MFGEIDEAVHWPEHKGRPDQDLKKARWYLDRLIVEVGDE